MILKSSDTEPFFSAGMAKLFSKVCYALLGSRVPGVLSPFEATIQGREAHPTFTWT
jgi:hypothetical protein